VVVGIASPRVGFPLQLQQAKVYYGPRVVLVSRYSVTAAAVLQ
jgi:hypothetical protein